MCALRRWIPASASIQAEQSLYCQTENDLDPLQPTKCPAKTLIGLLRCAVWSVFAGGTCNYVRKSVSRLIFIVLQILKFCCAQYHSSQQILSKTAIKVFSYNKLTASLENFRHVLPTQTQISLRIPAVWSESSLSAWRDFASLASKMRI